MTAKKLTEHEQKQLVWEQELEKKVELFFGEHIFLNLSSGRVGTLDDLKTLLIKNVSDVEDRHEYDSVIPLLRQACLDYEYLVTKCGSPPNPTILLQKYPRYFWFGNEQERKFGLLQILV